MSTCTRETCPRCGEFTGEADRMHKMVHGWLGPDPGKDDVERLARYMRDTLRVGGIKDCRNLIVLHLGYQP